MPLCSLGKWGCRAETWSYQEHGSIYIEEKWSSSEVLDQCILNNCVSHQLNAIGQH